MEIQKLSSKIFDSFKASLWFIDDWYDLAIMIGGKAHLFSYVHKLQKTGKLDELQKKIVIKDRTVYQSCPALQRIQKQLILLFTQMYELLPSNNYLLAYIKGRNPYTELKKCTGYRYLIKFDIRKYYDHITQNHLIDMLMNFGCSRRGATLISRYCVVQRKLPVDKTISTLQQGSPVSPVISNLIGHHFFDKYIMTWLKDQKNKTPNLEYQYLRYSDNIILFVDGDIPTYFLKGYKAYVKKVMTSAGFRTHKWEPIPLNHPKKHQKFLGVILNKVARIEKTRYLKLRATLFNMCMKGMQASCINYLEREAPHIGYEPSDIDGIIGVVVPIVRGKISYIKSINEKHYLMLSKLMAAALLINEKGMEGKKKLNQIKAYKNMSESIAEYLARF